MSQARMRDKARSSLSLRITQCRHFIVQRQNHDMTSTHCPNLQIISRILEGNYRCPFYAYLKQVDHDLQSPLFDVLSDFTGLSPFFGLVSTDVRPRTRVPKSRPASRLGAADAPRSCMYRCHRDTNPSRCSLIYFVSFF
jgi:hypothetical protein